MLFRTRRAWLIGQMMSNGVIGGIALGVITSPIVSAWATVAIGVVGAVPAALVALPGIHRRQLVTDDGGITAIRNGYDLHARWQDLSGFERRRFALIVHVTVLLLDDATVSGTGRRTMSDRRRARIQRAGADRLIQVGVYVDDPAGGTFGEILRRHRPDLVPARAG